MLSFKLKQRYITSSYYSYSHVCVGSVFNDVRGLYYIAWSCTFSPESPFDLISPLTVTWLHPTIFSQVFLASFSFLHRPCIAPLFAIRITYPYHFNLLYFLFLFLPLSLLLLFYHLNIILSNVVTPHKIFAFL